MASELTGEDVTSATTDSFVTALVFNSAVFGIQIGLFTLLRPHFKTIYEPRTYAPPPKKRISSLGSSLFGWIAAVFKADIEDIIPANGLDAYFFVRFVRMCLKIVFPIWIISWAVLLPVTSVRGTADGLDMFVFANVPSDELERYSAHLILAWFFTFYILYVVRTELSHFVYKRQLFLITPEHARSVMAHTLLITGIPTPYQSAERLTRLFKDIPGGVKTIWLNRNLKELPELYDRQIAACDKLEKAETALLKAATLAKQKADKQKAKIQGDPEDVNAEDACVFLPQEKDRPHHKLGFLGLFGEKVDTIEWARKEIRETTEELEKGRCIVWGDNAPWNESPSTQATQDRPESPGSHEPGTKDEDLDHTDLEETSGETSTKTRGFAIPIPGAKTVTDTVGQIGSQVKKGLDLEKPRAPQPEDQEQAKSITTHLKTAAGVVPVVGDIVSRDKSGENEYPLLNSAFITFNKQIGAHMASQLLLHSGPYRMAGKYLETSPEDVIWTNLGLDPYAMKVRSAISWALTIGLIVVWAFPVAFVGALSNIQSVCVTYSWLNWLCDLPDVVVGIIQGILPPVLLSILFMLLPIVLRLFAQFEGIPKRTSVELSLMTRYFLFQVVHGFLIVTLSSGIIAALEDLSQNPTQIPNLLATELPSASTFFLTFIILQGLAGTAGGFLQIVALIVYYVKLFILGSTPRSVFGIKFGLKMVNWGTLFPVTNLLIVITIGYMVISPIINGLALLTFFFFYMMWKYLFLWVYQQPHSSETGGLFFPKAIQHVFVGLYIQQVCLAALFFLLRDENGDARAVPFGALMVVLIVITALIHMIFTNSYAPLYYSLPLSLADKTYSGEDKASLSSDGDDDEAEMQARAGDVYHQEPLEKYGFAHPAASRPQRIIWIPEDTLNLWKGEVEGCRKEGVEADLGGGATMNDKGKVDVQGPGPGQEYHDLPTEEAENS